MSNAPLGPDPRKFGDYHLLRYFAAGGMADLYLAHNRRFGRRELVLKRIQGRYLDHQRVVRMFIEEGRIASRLEHRNVVRVLEVGEIGGLWYIAMEYIRGHDLVAIARQSAEVGLLIPRAVAVGILVQVAAGLAYAHTRADAEGRALGIVHCDVSPGNVVVSRRGVVKIVDFGIARAANTLREEGGVAGKYNYMAPEQVRGEPFDSRADLFPLGVMLHEFTVGKRLFRGRPEQVIQRVLHERIPRPSDLAPDYPPALERIVMRLLERDPARRYPSAAQVHDELSTFLTREQAASSEPDIAGFLATLFAAPPSDITDPSVIIEDLELGRGMPQSPDPPADSAEDEGRGLEPLPSPAVEQPAGIDDGPTAAIALPPLQQWRERMSVERTEIVRAPGSGRRPGPPVEERTMRVSLPRPRPAAAKRLSTAAVVAACAGALALLFLLAAWIAG